MNVAYITLLGVLLGSFVNALVWRLHEQRLIADKKATNKTAARLHDLSISRGRSMCPSCEHTLAPKDLVPILSWLWLRGKCRYCRVAISVQYPIVELLGGSIFGISYVVWPYDFTSIGTAQLVVWLAALVYMLALAVYDARWQLLPTVLIVPLGVLALIFSGLRVLESTQGIQTILVEIGLAVVLLWGLFRLLFAVSKGKWIGYGDVRLAIPLALFAGSPLAVCILLFVASFVGTLVMLPALLGGLKTARSTLPFGPYLLLGCWVVVLWGGTIVDWLNNSLLFA